MSRRAALVLFLVFGACIPALGQSAPITVNPAKAPADPAMKPPAAEPDAAAPRLKPSDLEGRQALENSTRMQLIRVIDAEFVHTRDRKSVV